MSAIRNTLTIVYSLHSWILHKFYELILRSHANKSNMKEIAVRIEMIAKLMAKTIEMHWSDYKYVSMWSVTNRPTLATPHQCKRLSWKNLVTMLFFKFHCMVHRGKILCYVFFHSKLPFYSDGQKPNSYTLKSNKLWISSRVGIN